jgi:hypothetical protein
LNEWFKQAHEHPLPPGVLDELQELERYARDARAHGVEPEKFLAMIEGERAKGYVRERTNGCCGDCGGGEGARSPA